VVKHSVLLDAPMIAARIATLAEAIRSDTRGPAPVVVVGLLTGSFVFVADLVRALATAGLDPLVDFMAVSHYGSAVHPTGEVQIRNDVTIDIRGQDVLLVDDILDSGLTLRRVRDHLAVREPVSLRTCVLLDKPERRLVPLDADYVGFVIPDRWVIGYGLDIGGHGRGLPYVGVVDPFDLPREEEQGR